MNSDRRDQAVPQDGVGSGQSEHAVQEATWGESQRPVQPGHGHQPVAPQAAASQAPQPAAPQAPAPASQAPQPAAPQAAAPQAPAPASQAPQPAAPQAPSPVPPGYQQPANQAQHSASPVVHGQSAQQNAVTPAEAAHGSLEGAVGAAPANAGVFPGGAVAEHDAAYAAGQATPLPNAGEHQEQIAAGMMMQEHPEPKGMQRTRGAKWIAATAAIGLLSVAGGYAGAALHNSRNASSSTPIDSAFVTGTSGGPAAERPSGSVAAVASKVLPSVVSLQVRTNDGGGSGSGFVLRSDGYILTNHHVIDGASDGGQVNVRFVDGTTVPARVTGSSRSYDLAVVKVDKTDLPVLKFGDSDRIVVGDSVVAVGAPLGLASTVTTGIVSAKNRPVSAGKGQRAAFINAVQTDAAINPGNSGGPLVDMNGAVVGINSAIAKMPSVQGAASGNIGLGFAIPSRQARRTALELIEHGRATYPVVGIKLDPRYQDGPGVRVFEPTDGSSAITPGSPAERAGIQAGDIVTKFNGRPINENDELIVAIRAQEPNAKVNLTVRRGDEERTIEMVLDKTQADS